MFTPLVIILSSLELLLNNSLENPEEREQFTKFAFSGAKQLKFVTDSLLYLNSLEHEDHRSKLGFYPPVNLDSAFWRPVNERIEYYHPKTLVFDYKIEVKNDDIHSKNGV